MTRYLALVTEDLEAKPFPTRHSVDLGTLDEMRERIIRYLANDLPPISRDRIEADAILRAIIGE